MLQRCSAGTVKKLALPTRMLHDKYSKALDLKEEMLEQLTEAMKFNKELKAHINRIFDSLNPVRVLSLFERMVTEVLIMTFVSRL
jgi:DNA-directed RNA polymerase III subunit RPC1